MSFVSKPRPYHGKLTSAQLKIAHVEKDKQIFLAHNMQGKIGKSQNGDAKTR